MRALLIICAVLAWSQVQAADACPVISVPGPDHVVLRFQGLLINVPLVYVDVPTSPAARDACQQHLAGLLKNRKVDLVYRPSFGTDPDGTARVLLRLGEISVNTMLVADGYARYRPGLRADSAYSDPVRKGQERAEAAQLGVWSKAGVWADASPADASAPAPAASDASIAEPTPSTPAPAAPAADATAAATPAAAPASAPAAMAPAADSSTSVDTASAPAAGATTYPGPFCSEIDSKFYFPSGHPGVATVSAQRLIFYPDEATAQHAGKTLSPQTQLDGLPTGNDEASADAVFAKGKQIYGTAVDAGNNSHRDDLYGQAFVIFSDAMRIYSALVEASPNNEALSNKLHDCMQLRYGALKYRRLVE